MAPWNFRSMRSAMKFCTNPCTAPITMPSGSPRQALSRR